MDVYSLVRVVLIDPIFWVEINTLDLKHIYKGTVVICGIDAFIKFTKTDEDIERVGLLLTTQPHSGWEFHKLHAVLKSPRGDYVFKVDNGLRTQHNLEFTGNKSQLKTVFWI